MLPSTSFSQVDTTKIRKEITTVLKNNGLKNAAFDLRVTSTNQKGGQTAFQITNNNFNENRYHIIRGNNNVVGINGDVTYGDFPVYPTQADLLEIMDSIPNRSDTVIFYSANSQNKFDVIYANALQDLLLNSGYPNSGICYHCYIQIVQSVKMSFDREREHYIRVVVKSFK